MQTAINDFVPLLAEGDADSVNFHDSRCYGAASVHVTDCLPLTCNTTDCPTTEKSVAKTNGVRPVCLLFDTLVAVTANRHLQSIQGSFSGS